MLIPNLKSESQNFFFTLQIVDAILYGADLNYY